MTCVQQTKAVLGLGNLAKVQWSSTCHARRQRWLTAASVCSCVCAMSRQRWVAESPSQACTQGPSISHHGTVCCVTLTHSCCFPFAEPTSRCFMHMQCVALHPVYTLAASASEDATIKVHTRTQPRSWGWCHPTPTQLPEATDFPSVHTSAGDPSRLRSGTMRAASLRKHSRATPMPSSGLHSTPLANCLVRVFVSPPRSPSSSW